MDQLAISRDGRRLEKLPQLRIVGIEGIHVKPAKIDLGVRVERNKLAVMVAADPEVVEVL